MRRAPKAVVVGGSIAGLSCAHALISAGWQVTVIEKSGAAPSGSPTGAGLGLDPQSLEIVGRWISNPDLLRDGHYPTPLHRPGIQAIYIAWRGVLDFSGEENSDTMVGIRKAYPELGHCLYFDLADRTHCGFYELRNRRLNWVWFVNAPEPENKGKSLTLKASDDMIQKMFEEAEVVWVPELAKIMKETRQPFINVIYDADPLLQLFWDNVVLVGDAAHPVVPNGARSTNMSILDAETLGLCLKKWSLENLVTALQEFQTIRHPVITKQVLHSRLMGRLKQGLPLHDNIAFDPKTASQCR